MAYIYLTIAILAEVTATSALKASEEFTRWLPSTIVLVGYIVSFYFMTLTLRYIPIGMTYAIWSGAGIVLIALIGRFFYQQPLDTPAMIGMGLIIIGIVVIHLFSKSARL